jgi:hypothetical protein
MLGYTSSSILITALILIQSGVLAAPIPVNGDRSASSAETSGPRDFWNVFDAPSTPKTSEARIDYDKIAKAPFLDITEDRLQPLSQADFVYPETSNSFASKMQVPLEEQLLSADHLMNEEAPSTKSRARVQTEKAKALSVKKEIAKAVKKSGQAQAKSHGVSHVVGEDLFLHEAPSLKTLPDLPSSALNSEMEVFRGNRSPGRKPISMEGVSKLLNAIKL